MPKLPVVSGSEVVRALERLGFTVTRQRGSHIVMRRGSAGCAVPNHREVKVGTLVGLLKQGGVSPRPRMTLGRGSAGLVGLLKQAGVSPDEFVEALHA